MTDPRNGVEIVRDRHRFIELGDHWDKLAEAYQAPLATHTWHRAILDALKDHPIDPSIVAVWDNGELAAIAPLIIDRAGTPARLVPIDALIGEPFYLLARDGAALRALCEGCAALQYPMIVRRLVASDADLATISTALRSNAVTVLRQRHASAVVLLPESFDAFEGTMSTARRSTIRRKWRAAIREHGSISTEFVTPTPDELPQHLARFIEIEGSGWKGERQTAMSSDRAIGQLVDALAYRFAADGMFQIAYLKMGEHLAASRLMIRHHGTLGEIKIAFDQRFARYSPGILMMHETLREACRTGISTYAFLGLKESWQDHWPHQVIEDWWLASYPIRPSGFHALVADAGQALTLALRRRLG